MDRLSSMLSLQCAVRGCKFGLVLALLLVLSQSYCSYQCKTCIESYSNTVSYRCASCYDGYFLQYQQCYNCNEYKSDQCSSNSGTSSTFEFVVPAVVFFAAAMIIFCCCRFMCLKCKDHFINREQIQHNLPAPVRFQQSYSYGIHLPPAISMQEISMQAYNFSGQWKKDGMRFNEKQVCVICLEQTVSLKTHCNHSFHPNCIEEWVRKKQGGCPLCKSKELSPANLYCRECFESYKEVGFGELSIMVRDNSWKKLCNNCEHS